MFALSIPLSSSTLNAIKLALTASHSDVKSSHRCEALGRGLGFRTYAALLASLRCNNPSVAPVNAAAFTGYLAEHDFNVAASALYRAAAVAALGQVSTLWPRLTIWGFGLGDRDRLPNGEWETGVDRRRRFEDGRARLVSCHEADAFLASLALVSRVERTKTIRPATNSYWLKHIAENYECSFPDGERLGPVYVPNGVFIAAAIHAGFTVKPHTDDYGAETLNAGFNMGKASLYDLDCEVRPDGGRGQARRERKRRQNLGSLARTYHSI